VETGYVYDHLVETLRPQGAEMRQALLDRGAKVVMAVFDSQTHPNTHFSYDHLRQFYGAVVAAANARSDLGLIVKSKKPGIIASLGHLANELDELKRAGRCLIVDQPLTSMIPAAVAADVAIGFPASTAACEAALAGCRVLMYDPSRSASHPWARAGADIMFHDIASFAGALARVLDAAREGAAGMPQARLLEIDPFLDQQAPKRAAEFINSFLGARAGGADKRASVSAALASCAGHGIALDA
jgi:hypothetical protein